MVGELAAVVTVERVVGTAVVEVPELPVWGQFMVNIKINKPNEIYEVNFLDFGNLKISRFYVPEPPLPAASLNSAMLSG